MTTTAILLDLFVKTAVVLIAAHLALFFFRRSAAGVRHLVLSSAIIALLALPFTTPFLSVVEIPLLPITNETSAGPVLAERLTIRSTPPGNREETSSLLTPNGETVTETEVTGSAVARTVNVPDESTTIEISVPLISLESIRSWLRTNMTFPLLFAGLWLAGSTALLLHLVTGVARVQWIAERALPLRDERTQQLVEETRKRVGLEKAPGLLISPDLSVPVVWGFTSPVLLLPLESADWSDDRRKAVLLHELAHIARCDGITLILTKIAVSLYWINPLVWTAARMARRYCERACDDIVLERGTLASEYADHLLAIARTLPDRERLTTVTLAMSRRSEIEGRLLAILHPDLQRSSITRRAFLIAACVAALLVASVSSFRLTADEKNRMPNLEPSVAIQPVGDPDLEVAVRGESLDGFDADLDALGDHLDDRGAARQDYEYEVWQTGANASSNSNSNSNWNTNWNINVSDEDDRDRKKARADKRLTKKEQNEAARIWEKAWNAHQSDRFDESIPLFMRTAELGYRPDASRYNVACGYAMKGEASSALTWLQRAIDHGFDDWNLLRKDSDLDPIRSDPRFRALIDALPGREKQNDNESASRRAERWKPAIAVYTRYTSSHPDSGRAWWNLGWAQHMSGRYAIAIDSFERAHALGYRPGNASYNIACGHARLGHNDLAFRWLERAAQQGFDLGDRIRWDEDLASLRSDPRTRALFEKTEKEYGSN